MDLQEVLSQVITRTNEIFEAEAGSVALLEPNSQKIVIRAAVGAGADAVRGLSLPAGKGVVGWVVTHEKPALIPNVGQGLTSMPRAIGRNRSTSSCALLRCRKN